MNVMVKQCGAAIRVLLVFTVLLGVGYPLSVWLVSRIPGLESNAEGSVLTRDGRAVGSASIGVDPVYRDAPPDDPNTPGAENLAEPADPWFHTRPSASYSGPDDYPADAEYPAVLGQGDPSVSGGSNLASYNEELIEAVRARKDTIAAREGAPVNRVPADAVTASASGVDPNISTGYAELQAARVARNNQLDVREVRELIARHTGSAGIGIPGVNVLELNLAVQHRS